MIQKAIKFKNKFLLFQIFITELFFSIYILLLGFKKYEQFLSSVRSATNKHNENEILRCEQVASRLNGIKKCLTRNGTIFYFLKKHNIQCALIIGISNDDEFKSHCWVETQNKIIDFDKDKAFKEIYRI